jgi:hypothetical protein
VGKIAAILLALWLALAVNGAAAAVQVPPVCEGGAWVVVYPGVEGHRWYNPLYPINAPENHYGAGQKYTPCYPVGSTQNGYGAGYDGVSKP